MEKTEVKEISAEKTKDCFLSEIESASNGVDTIAGYFERMKDQVGNDDSPENYWLMGFSTGFKLAREIDADYHGMAILNTSRKLHGQ